MALSGVVLELALVVVTMLVATTLVIVGPRRLAAALGDLSWRLESVVAPVAVLLAVLVVRWATQDVAPRLSWRVVGWNITPLIFQAEAAVFGTNPVTALQSLRTAELTAFFVFVYIYGYVFLITFPVLAYLSLDRMDHLRTLLVAYTANYGIGLLCYVLFIAFGPRNYNPLLFADLLYEAYPQARLLTDQVNQYTNVFPSLHTSLSMTTVFVAWHSRESYPLWLPLSATFALSVTLSTMYLGIHWFSDVLAGTVLALISVYLGRRYAVESEGRSIRTALAGRIRAGDPEHERR